MRKHHAILYQDRTCRKLFTDEEKDNLRPVFQKGAYGIRNKGYWIPVAGKPNQIRIFTDNCVLTCEKIDPTKGPMWNLP